ncbi:uncharacterized protein LOC130804044 [Amaranthus tricolor]|uniref:uncharacterized protein LOC130804044 n=1 Tax=Amaranthus tricolor TaxID=29722 RepID=UPI002584C477|nr:uncharacterized protein LOC130804044 [Amaranthus tricolor]
MEDGVTVREREETFHEEETDREKRQKVEGGGGILDNLLSKFVPESVHNEVQDHATACDQQSVGDSDGDGSGGGGGGVINNFISNLLHRNNNAEGDEDAKNDNEESEEQLKSANEETDNHVKTDPESNGVGEGGTSSNHGASIISSLIPEVVAPAPDEASILIHSIVHD